MAKDKGTTIDGFELDLIDLSGIDLGSDDDTQRISKRADKEKLVEDYLKKMKTKADFPIFSKQLGDINRILTTKYASAEDISNVITREISLTNKLLKLVNSSFYGNFTRDGEIKTITQAMIIIGTDQVQKASSSLIHFENMQKNSQTKELMDVSIGTFLSGMIAKNIVAEKVKKLDAEEAFICAMFYNLGMHLVMFYNYDDYQKIKKLVERGMDREAASREVIGISYEDLGLGVAKKWGLPQYIIHSMSKSKVITDETKSVKRTRKDWLLNIAFCSNEFCSSLLGDSDVPLASVIKKFKNVFELSEKSTKDIIESSFTKLLRYSSTLKIDPKESELLNRVKTLIDNEKSKIDRKTIFKGIEKITEMLKSPFYTYHMVLADIVDIMYDGFKYDRVMICIRDIETNEFVCRYGKGKDFLDLINTFRFKMQEKKSIFEIALENQRDIIIPDLKNSSYVNKIPEWFSKILDTNTFVIYPVVIKGVPTGLFYADTTYKTILESNVQKNMKTLRDLALRAIKQRI